MSDLKANLDTLNEAVPALGAKLETVVQEAEAYEKAVQEALENFAERKQQGEELLSRVKSVLEKVEQQAGEQETRLGEGRDAVETAVEGAKDSFEEGSDGLNQTVKPCGDALNSLEEALTDGGSRAKSAAEDSRDALQRLAGQVEDGQNALEAASQDVRDEVEAVEKAIAESEKQVDDGVTDLAEKIGDIMDQIEERLADTQDKLREWRQGQEPAIDEAISELVDGKDELFKDLQESVENDIRQELDTRFGQVLEAIAGLSDSFKQTADTIRTHREATQPLFESLEERLPPLKAGVEAVKGGAKTVGLDWQ